MESHESQKPHLLNESPKPNASAIVQSSGNLSKDFGSQRGKSAAAAPTESMGALEVYIHQARDIQNICIYHKQDVYAKLSLTSDPDVLISTEIVPAGGRNPIFDQKLRLDVRTLECSLKCEIWMLSRIRNYMGDQYLGFALVPLSDVLLGNVKSEQEFTLSSTDLTHTPVGFVQLSITYDGLSPEVLEIPVPCSPVAAKTDSASDLDKIEFPDPKIINETRMLVSEYFQVPRPEVEPENSVSMGTADNDTEVDDHAQEVDSIRVLKSDDDERPEGVSTDGSLSITDTSAEDSKSPNENGGSTKEEKPGKAKGVKNKSSSEAPTNTTALPAVKANMEEELTMVQQDIVEMYMKGMREFTDSLAKMKLPTDTENASVAPTNGSSGEKSPVPKENGPKVFYGSRAFY